MRLRSTALAVASLLAQAGVQAAITFDIIDLSQDQPTGGLASIATGINNDGHIVGNLIDGSGVQSDGWFLGAGSTTWSSLGGNLTGYVNQRVTGISNSNLILGSTLNDLYGGPGHAVTWSLSKGQPLAATAFDPLTNGYQPLGLNASGKALFADNSRTVIYLYSGGTLVDISNFGGRQPLALNDAGTVAGSFLAYTGRQNPPRHAFVTLDNGTDLDLSPDYGPPYPTPYASEATALNNSGQVVLQLYDGAYGSQSEPFLWSGATGLVGLNSMVDTAGGRKAQLAQVTSINDNGQIVGQDRAGNAALLMPRGTMNWQTQNQPNIPGHWDTPLGLLPTRALDFVVAPAGFGPGSVQVQDIGLGAPDVTAVKSLTLGTPGYGPLPGRPGYFMAMSLNIRASGQFRVGGDTQLSLLDGSSIQAASTVNQGWVGVGSATFSGDFVNDGGRLEVSQRMLLQGALTNQIPFNQISGFGQVFVRGGATMTVTGTIDNQAWLQIDPGGSVAASSFTQRAGTLTVDGELNTQSGTVAILGGSIYGSGTINTVRVQPIGTRGANAVVGNVADSGSVVIGGGSAPAVLHPGRLTINGALVIAANGSLDLQIDRGSDGSLSWGQVAASSISLLDGSSVHFIIGDGVGSDQLQTLSFLQCADGCSFAPSVSFVVDGAPGAQIAFGSEGLQLTLPPAQAVPEPSTAALWLAGVLGLGWLMRRRPDGAAAG